jgi:hypothetical protein
MTYDHDFNSFVLRAIYFHESAHTDITMELLVPLGSGINSTTISYEVRDTFAVRK